MTTIYPDTLNEDDYRVIDTLPSMDLLREVVRRHTVIIEARRARLFRAAPSVERLTPRTAASAGRFGPPKAVHTQSPTPWFWVYMGDSVSCALWEAQLCRHDATQPGRFFLAPGHAHAEIGEFEVTQPIALIDLVGEASSAMGIFDQLSSSSHLWCQWLGWQLDQIVQESSGSIYGIRYPSRKHQGSHAFAFSSRYLPGLYTMVKLRRAVPFVDTPEYSQLLIHPSLISWPFKDEPR